MSVELALNSSVARGCAHSLVPAMLRDLDGNILLWNRAAEKNYGILEREALGNVSHLLLSTVFPEPLADINRQLVKTGKWSGELIHTLQDGQKVKVQSHWELSKADSATCVLETNTEFAELDPKSAHLTRRLSITEQAFRLFIDFKFWWLIPFILTLVAVEIIFEMSPHIAMFPLEE